MKNDFALGQLRHLYSLMMKGHVKDTAEAARGLLGPSIAALEQGNATSSDVERAATIAWNESIEQAAKRMEEMRVNAEAEVARSTAEPHKSYWTGQSFGLMKAVVAIRALKRPA